MRAPFQLLLSLTLAPLLTGGVSAQTGVDSKLDSLRAQAAKLAAAGHYPKAVDRLSEARAALRADRRRAMGAAPRSKVNPRYRAELQRLSARVKAKWKKGPQTAALRQALMKEYVAGKKSLERRHPPLSAGASSTRASEVARTGARYTLVDADLLDRMAGYLEKAAQKVKARGLREQALTQKLEAYRGLGQLPQAGQVAGRLLALSPTRPEAYRQAAEFYQERRRYAEAAAAWRRGIDGLEAGRVGADAASRSQALPGFYRQLAFAYSKSGKAAESRQALEHAQRLERGGG